ncbi:MAG: FAD:protein FMN transferase, partial [Sedimentisphaerales bacterium]|nr:FAD:protein FMN transferase [Sedimentisphaerales bacterium]
VCLLIARNKPASPVEIDSGYRLVMGTFARVVAVASDAETAKKCVDAAFEQLQHVDKSMSAHDPCSEISMVNRLASKEPVKVSESTFDVLERSMYFSRLSNGAFDVTAGPLVDLWRASGDANMLPTPEQISAARAKVGYRKLILDANNMTVRFAVDGMKLDLGAIAKGYAVDKTVDAMKAAGSRGGMVDAGGNIRCFGTPSKGKTHWLIGLQDPNVTDEQMKADRTILTLKFTDNAVATSGDYRRFVVVGGRRHSHIINPATGQSSESLASVTIICPNATDADALSTAVTVMGKEKGLAFIEQIPDVEAILITPAPEFKQTQTPGAEKYIK